MTLTIYTPVPPLSHFVHYFWLWENYHPPHPKERILPGGMMELVINLADEPMQLYYPHNHFQQKQIYGPIVAGARSEYFLVDTRRSASILSVWFKPGAALQFFGASGRELQNLHISLADVWGRSAHDLYCQLMEAHTPNARFHILEQALLARLLRAKRRHRVMNFVLAAFGTPTSPQSIAAMVEQTGIGLTRFIQVFSEDIGLTPKLFQRVQRFQTAIQYIAQAQTVDYTDVALMHGYFDQAHFINDFQAFAGITPSVYVPQSPQHASNLAVYNEK